MEHAAALQDDVRFGVQREAGLGDFLDEADLVEPGSGEDHRGIGAEVDPVRPAVRIERRFLVDLRAESPQGFDRRAPLIGFEQKRTDRKDFVLRRLWIVCRGVPEERLDPVRGMVGACPQDTGKPCQLLRLQ